MNRIEKIQEFLLKQTSDKVNVDAVIIGSEVNRKYLLDMHSSAGTIVVLKDCAYFIIDFRYIEKAKTIVKDCNIILQEKLHEQIKDIFTKHNVKTVGVEDDTVTVAQFDKMQKELECVELIKNSGLSEFIQNLRKYKSDDEIKTLIKAQEITDKSFLEILNFIKKGKTEKEISAYLEYTMKMYGSDGLSFDTIVVGGVNSSLPHGEPSDYVIQEGDFITMDFGALLDGYHADMTRTVAVGSVSDEQLKVYNTVLEAQKRALAGIKLGMKCKDVDKLARDYIYDNGYKGCFGHSLGHSVGLEIHESPNFSPLDENIVENGLVVTVEPGIYLENKFGVRIEDVVVIQNDKIINITNSKKQLIIL